MSLKYKIEDGEVRITGHTDKSIKSIIIPEFIENLPVTNIGAFSFCGYTSLTQITIPNQVNIISNSAFRGCYSLIEVNIPNSVINIDYEAFSECTSLKEIITPNSVTNVGNYAFSQCKSLNHINIPNSITNIGINAFMNCNSIKEINGVKLKEGSNFINNRFIYHYQGIYKILYQIDEDYICDDKNIFINGERFKL